MRKIIESLFELFFPNDLDENGKEIINPEGDETYPMKVFAIIMFIIIMIFTIIALR